MSLGDDTIIEALWELVFQKGRWWIKLLVFGGFAVLCYFLLR